MAHADIFVGSSTSGIPSIIYALRMSVYEKSLVGGIASGPALFFLFSSLFVFWGLHS
jgi:hypothetical protein